MGSVQSWLYENLQHWTPFSVLVVLAGVACIFILVWDIITGTGIQPSIIAILSVLIGSSGTATLFNHGIVVANGVANSTARAVVAEMNSQPLPPPDTSAPKGVAP